MYGRQIAGGAQGGCKHLVRYVSSKVRTDHACKQARGTSSRQPRELHTCISDSKWRAMKALNLNNFAAYSEVAFKSRKDKKGDCSINVIKDDVSKETPCIINIYLKSSGSKHRNDDDDDVEDNKKKREVVPWEEINESKTNWLEAQTKLFTPRHPIETDANVLRTKLLAVKVERNEERRVKVERSEEGHVKVERNEEMRVKVERNEERQTTSSESPKGERQELYAQHYNVSVYNCKTIRNATEYQAEDNSKETTVSKIIDLAYKQPEASGISRLLSFCRKLLATDFMSNPKNETRVDAAKTYKVARIFRPYPAGFTPVIPTIKPRISPRTLSDFKAFKASGFDNKQVCRLQRCHFSSKSNMGKEGEKKRSMLKQCINKIFAHIKKRLFGEAKTTTRQAPPTAGEAKMTTREAPPTAGVAKMTTGEVPSSQQKISGKDACLEKSLARVKEISPPTGEAMDVKKTLPEAPPPVQKPSGKDTCLEKSLARVREIIPPSAGDGAKAKAQIGNKEEISSSKPVDTCKEKGVVLEKQAAKDTHAKVEEKPKRICSRQSPLPLNASQKEKSKEATKEKAAESSGASKKDPSSKQDPCAKDVNVPTCQPNPTCNMDTSKAPAAAKPSCDANDSKKEKMKAEVFVDKRCIQDGDTSMEELEGAEKDGKKGGKRDKCMKYRETWQQKMAAKKKESCIPENAPKRDICSQNRAKYYYMSRRNMSNKGPCSGGGSGDKKSSKAPKDCKLQEDASCKDTSKKDPCSSGGGSKKDSACPSEPPKHTCVRGEGKDTTCAVGSKKTACYKGGRPDKSKMGPCSARLSKKKDTSSQSGAGGATTRECAYKTKVCSKGGSVEEGGKPASKKDTRSQGGAAEKHKPSGDTSKKDPCSQIEAKQKGGASASKEDTCSQAGAKRDATKKDPCSDGDAKEKASASSKGSDPCESVSTSSGGPSKKDTSSQSGAGGATTRECAYKTKVCSKGGSVAEGGTPASKKDTRSQGGAGKHPLSGDASKKDPCSQIEAKQKGGASASKKDTCSQAGAKRDASKKDPCSDSGAKASKGGDPCASSSKKDICSQDGAKGDASKKDPCSQGGTKGKTSASKGGDPCASASKKDTCSQGGAKKDPCRQEGTKKETCSQGKNSPAGKSKTKDDCDKFTVAKKEGLSEVCSPIFSKDEEHDYDKCKEDTDEAVDERCATVDETVDERCETVDDAVDERCATVVEAWDPPHDIMDALGSMLDETNEDEIDDYYGDSYPNHMYYMYTREFFYDVNAMLQPCRQPQPIAPFKGKQPIKTEDSCEDD